MYLLESFSIWLVLCILYGRSIHASLSHKRRRDDQNPFQEPVLLPYYTGQCGSLSRNPISHCLFSCAIDFRCQELRWNTSILDCGCPAQYCPDGRIYITYDYTKDTSLTDEQLAYQPHVSTPCNGCVPRDIAPFYEQIGDCGALVNYTQSETNGDIGCL